jgi:hypothetical protein
MSLLEQLTAAFVEEPDIDELGVIFPLPDSPDHAPATAEAPARAAPKDPDAGWIVLQGRKLGVSVHHLKRLYREARAAFWPCLAVYRQEGSALLAQQVLACSRGMLLVNADHATAW